MKSIYKSEIGKKAVLETYAEILKAWPVPSRQYTVNTAYGDTFVIEFGDSTKPALLLLHGSMANSFTWFGDAPQLCQHYHVFAVDLIGEAGLSAESRPAYGSGAYEKWLDEILQSLGVKTCAIVGLSLGGWTALRYATVFPEKVTHLALLCPGGLARERRDFLWKAMLQKLRGSKGRGKTLQGVMNKEESEGMQRAFAYMMLIAKHERPRMAKLTIFNDAELTKLTMPVLVLFGDHDIMLRAEQSIARIARLAPNAETELLPNTGHAVVGQSARILKFLQSHPT